MTSNVLAQIKSLVTSQLIYKLSKQYEESEMLIKKTIDTCICTVLMGLYNKMDDIVLFDNLMESISNSNFYDKTEFQIGNPTLITSFDPDGNLPLNLIFSSKKGRISETISNELGIKSETAAGIFSLSVFFILSYFKNQNQSSKELYSILEDQKRVIINTIPEGIRIMLGFSNFECFELPVDKKEFKARFINNLFGNNTKSLKSFNFFSTTLNQKG